ncbi:hypothetical protein B296_00005846, partial [Ensete ventricosum]
WHLKRRPRLSAGLATQVVAARWHPYVSGGHTADNRIQEAIACRQKLHPATVMREQRPPKATTARGLTQVATVSNGGHA